MESQTEDRLLDVLKTVGARVDSAVGTFTNLSNFGRSEQSAVGPHIPRAWLAEVQAACTNIDLLGLAPA